MSDLETTIIEGLEEFTEVLERPYRLDVFRNLDVASLVEDDHAIEAVVGKKAESRGSNFQTRDMQFWFATEAEYETAKAAVLAAGYRLFP